MTDERKVDGMTPNYTPDQKEHIRMAQRADMRIQETWSLFAMFLSQGKPSR